MSRNAMISYKGVRIQVAVSMIYNIVKPQNHRKLGIRTFAIKMITILSPSDSDDVICSSVSLKASGRPAPRPRQRTGGGHSKEITERDGKWLTVD